MRFKLGKSKEVTNKTEVVTKENSSVSNKHIVTVTFTKEIEAESKEEAISKARKELSNRTMGEPDYKCMTNCPYGIMDGAWGFCPAQKEDCEYIENHSCVLNR